MSSGANGRTFLVTGANTGIGRATAIELARRGGAVIVGARTIGKAMPVVQDILKETGRGDAAPFAIDLADLESVADAARRLIDGGRTVHVLVNNAGVGGQQGLTKQGFEVHFGVNHLGHFLLTTMLLDRLRESARMAGQPSRVVTVSSDSHYQPKGIDLDAVREPGGFTGVGAYGVSKLCNVLFAQELARRVPADEVVSVSLHPGVVKSDIWRRVPIPFRWLMKAFMISTEKGAETSVHCATADEVLHQNGQFFTKSKPKDPSAVATPELAAELWRRSEEWTAPYR